MIQGKLKILKDKAVAIYITRKDSVHEDAPYGQWRPGIGFVEPNDSMIVSADDAGLVCSKYCYSVTTVTKDSALAEMIKDLKEGTIIKVQIGRGKVHVHKQAA